VLSKDKCTHLNLNVIYMENEEGSVQLEICKNKDCARIITICEHTKMEWVFTRSEENPTEQMLVCKLCGADGT
jgi:hypothetical protein